MQVTLKGLWVKQFPATKGTSSFPFLIPMACASFLWPSLYVSLVMISAIKFLLDFGGYSIMNLNRISSLPL
jgi:hypothetical protein